MESVATEKPLTRRLENFCQEYLTDLNRTRAAVRAGFSAKTAYQQGYRAMKDSRVKARIAELMREREENTRVKGYKVLEELAVVALSSIDHYLVDETGHVTTREDAPAGAMGALSRVKRKRRVLEVKGEEKLVEYETEFSLFDKNPAITNALKHLGLLNEEVHHRDLTLEDLIREAAETPANANSDVG